MYSNFYILLLLTISSSVFCREPLEKLAIGLKVGIGAGYYNKIEMYEEDGYIKSDHGNFASGLIIDYKINKNFHAGGELIYHYRGGGFQKINNEVINLTFSLLEGFDKESAYNHRDHKLRSIDVPLYLRSGFSRKRTFYFITTGISPSLLVKSIYRYNTWNLDGTFVDDDWHESTIDKLDNTLSFALIGGLGIHFNFRKVVLLPEIRYTHFINNELVINDVIQDSKNYMVNISFAILFH